MASLIAAGAVLLSGCTSGDQDAPETLMDGSPAREAPVDLENIESPTVLTTVQVVHAPGGRGSWAETCLRDGNSALQAGTPAVERVGVASQTVTIPVSSGSALVGCDDSLGMEEEGGQWCGGNYGVLYDGQLRDPRLDIGCTTADGKPMGHAWVQPAEGVRYVTVVQPGYSEVYEVAGDLPVRIATITDVEIEGSRASFDVSEHDADGNLLREYEVEAAVAG